MKKILGILCILIIVFLVTNKQKKQVIIPKDSIRFRVIANSNDEKDQLNKKIVVSNLETDVISTLNKSNNLEESRKAIKSNLKEFESNINKTLIRNGIEENFKINYGNNYFPEKNYKGVKYSDGYYESLVVTLGNGQGSNFWCVLFPPLCLIEGEETNSSEIEYSSFIKEIIDKYF